MIHKIQRVVENRAILDQINIVLEQGEGNFYDELTDEQKPSVQRGLSQLESGNTVS